MGQAAWVGASLVAGIVLGILLGAVDWRGEARIMGAAEAIGTMWVNGIRMTVIPLIVSLLVVGVAAPSERGRIGSLGLRAFVFFYVSLVAVAVGSAVVAPPLFGWLELDPAGVAALRTSAGASRTVAAAADLPTFGEWLVTIVPTNPVRAAADAALLPLVLFTLAFAYALARVEEPGRAAVIGFFRGVGDAMLVLVRWVLLLAPIGVFALALVLGTRLGAGVVGAIGFYMGVQIALLIVAGLVMYPIAATLGRMPMRRFARAVAPAQLVAVTTRSSFAALPAGLEASRRVLGIPAEVAGFVLPLAVSIFRYTSPIQWMVGALFVAQLYGVDFGFVQVATVCIASILLNATVPGIPSGGLLVQAPVYAAVGLPVEGLAILIAVDMIPDLFRTTSNVTGHMAALAVLGRDVPSAARGEHVLAEEPEVAEQPRLTVV